MNGELPLRALTAALKALQGFCCLLEGLASLLPFGLVRMQKQRNFLERCFGLNTSC